MIVFSLSISVSHCKFDFPRHSHYTLFALPLSLFFNIVIHIHDTILSFIHLFLHVDHLMCSIDWACAGFLGWKFVIFQ